MKTLWWYLPLEALAVLLAQQALGFDPVHAVILAITAAAMTVLLLALPDIRPPYWPRGNAARTDGARDQISALSWAFMTRDDSVSVRGLHAVRTAATTRLALHGVDLTDPTHAPAARALLGDRAHLVLTQDGPPPSMTQIGHCIDRLAAITPTRSPSPSLRTPR